jgi:NAD(P)H-dependent FMN reductase
VVTGEYSHGPASAVKNAFDYLYAEWHDKPVGFVSYGSAGGSRAVEQLCLVAIELRLAPVAAQVTLPIATDFPGYPDFTPAPGRDDELSRVLDQVEAWSAALAPLRQE